jgi:hypothetical protein
MFFVCLVFFRFHLIHVLLGFMPLPAPLLDDSKYRTTTTTQLQNPALLTQQHYQQNLDNNSNNRGLNSRPYSYTAGMNTNLMSQDLGRFFESSLLYTYYITVWNE